MAQVVTNLVEDAIKYAPRGQITLRARRVQDGALVEVQDEGPGIPPQEQGRVLEKFYRGSGVAGRNGVPGSGIGLAVVRALVEAQGGTVGLHSAPDQGSTFWIEVPLAREQEGEDEDVAEAAPADSQVEVSPLRS
jgi:signal transduction histidine kinase